MKDLQGTFYVKLSPYLRMRIYLIEAIFVCLTDVTKYHSQLKNSYYVDTILFTCIILTKGLIFKTNIERFILTPYILHLIPATQICHMVSR